jgi:uncharacterized protein YndB with AHSA1/START domain
MDSDRIETRIELPFSVARVWRALTHSEEFGAWFGVRIDGPFEPGHESSGQVVTPGMEHLVWRAVIQDMEPQQYFAYTWHPYAVDPSHDYSEEVPTLVEIHLAATPAGGTALTLAESGFQDLPDARRSEAYAMQQQGWLQQMKNIRAYLDLHP